MKKILFLTAAVFFPGMCFASQEEYEAFRYYAYVRDTASVRQLIRQGYDIDAVDGEGDSALCAAVYDGDTGAFNLLASFGADLNHPCVRQMSEAVKRDFNRTLNNQTNSYSAQRYRLPVSSERQGGVFTKEGILLEKSSGKSVGFLGLSPTALTIAGTVTVGGVAIAVGSSGGGGSSSSSSVSSGGTEPEKPEESLPATDFETEEYKYGNFLQQVNASSAYARGYFGYDNLNGEKVKVGVFDDTIYADHPDLADNILQTFDMTNGQTSGTDDDGNPITIKDLYHGTHVSGIIAAVRNGTGMHGVAPEADLLVSYYGFNNSVNMTEALTPLMDNGARVINISQGYSCPEDWPDCSIFYADKTNEAFVDNPSYTNFEVIASDVVSALRRASTEGIVIVNSAGNEGNANPGILSGAPLAEEFSSGGTYSLDNLFITVVSVNSKNEISDFSNRCGVAQEYCLAAPGGNLNPQEGIVSTISGTYGPADYYGYAGAAGTSMAAPVVTGSVAVLMGAFPHLSAQEVVSILFETATDLGTPGVDEVYGHGLVNLEKATAPIGTLALAQGETVSSARSALGDTSLKLPYFLNASVLKKLPDNVAVLDKYSRAYLVPTSSFVKQAEKSDKAFLNNLRMLGARAQTRTVHFSDSFSFSFSDSASISRMKLHRLTQRENKNSSLGVVGNFSFAYDFSKSASVGLYYADDTKYGQVSWFDKPLENPFLEKRRAYGVKNAFALSDTVRFESVLEAGTVYFDDLPEEEDWETLPKVYSAQSKLTWAPKQSFSLSFLGGFMSEEDSLLGLQGKGALQTNTSSTYFTGVQASFQPTENLKLSAAWFYGVSEMPENKNAFVRFDRLQSSSFAVDARYKLSQKSFAGVSFSSPLGIEKGSALFNLPVGRHPTEDIVYRAYSKVSLESERREYDLSFYHARRGELFDVRTAATVRFNPDQEAGARPDCRLMVYMTSAF